MTGVIRFDAVKIPKVKSTKEGYLRGEAVVSRAGVFKYRNADGTVRGELRHPSEVFKSDSLETLKMIPVTLDHPPVFVNAENVHLYQVGYTGEHYDVHEDKITVSITVTHQDAINAVLDSKQELSLGYSVELIPEKGTYNGEEYEYRQTLPSYNHLAIVTKGRAGSEARFRFDSACELVEVDNLISEDKIIMKEETMEEGARLRIDALSAEKELLGSQLAQVKTKLDHIEKALENTKKQLEAEKALKAEDVIEQRVIERAALFSYAMPYLKDIEGYLRHTDREIMESVMNIVRTDSIDFSGQSDDFVKGMFYNFIGVSNRRTAGKNNVFDVVVEHYDNAHASIHDHLIKKTQEDWARNTQTQRS